MGIIPATIESFPEFHRLMALNILTHLSLLRKITYRIQSIVSSFKIATRRNLSMCCHVGPVQNRNKATLPQMITALGITLTDGPAPFIGINKSHTLVKAQKCVHNS